MIFDFSRYLADFCKNYLKLPDEDKISLANKKDLNIDRLKEGLAEYNLAHNTNYSITNFVVQGSMAMDTAIQDDENDFDIDIGVVFDYRTVKDLGHREIKNIIRECFLNKWPEQFSSDPEVKKNCVRISYQEGYHLDYAVYRFSDDYRCYCDYEHAGSVSWNKRNPNAILKWFEKQIADKGEKLRDIIRMSKALSRAFGYKEMTGGLIQTVLCAECFCPDERLDLCFYYTIKYIVERLNVIEDVFNPTSLNTSLIQTDEHRQQLKNYKSSLKSAIEKLDVLYKSGGGFVESADTWNTIFDCEYWNIVIEESYAPEKKNQVSVLDRNDYEEFIEDLYTINPNLKKIKLECKIGFKNNNRKLPIQVVRARYKGVPLGPYIYVTACPSFDYDKLLWKVRNRGENARSPDKIRGQIVSDRGLSIEEHSDFSGDHYIECYAIKNGYCVGFNRTNIKIVNKTVTKGKF